LSASLSADSAPYDVVLRGLRRYIKQNREQGHLHRADVLFVLKKERMVLKYTPTLFQGNGFHSTFPKWDDALKWGVIFDI